MFSSRKYGPGALAVAVLVLAAATLHAIPARAVAELPVFDGERAMEFIVQQCSIGPRTPGSAGNRELRERITALADSAGLGVRQHCFSAPNPMGEGPVRLCNVIVSTAGDRENRLWLGAHYDSRPVCDRDPDPARRDEPLTGANDGGSGTAVLMHLIELLGRAAPPRGVDLIFFDGEDSGHAGSVQEFCLGSRRLAETLGEFSNPLAGKTPRGLILLDMIGERDVRIPQEAYSLRYAAEFVDEVFGRALILGLDAFVPEPGPGVYDDHVPFLVQGIPAVDLIDFDFPQWHTVDDTPEICSSASLEQVGRLLVDLIYRP